ncbi:hypothetical protein BsWGS_03299 [Bradybaena similaris]
MEEDYNTMKDFESDLSSSPLTVQLNRIQDVASNCYMKEYNRFCQRHPALATVEQQAYVYLQDLIDQGICETPPKIEQVELFASVIYMALIDARLPYGPSDPHLENGSLEPPSVTVMDLLMLADININKLFQTMAIIKVKQSLSASVQSHLTQMEKNYCIVSALFHTFQSRLSTTVFRNSNSCGFDETFLPPIPESEGVEFRKKQCWLLFLLSKYHLLPDRLELFQHFQLLLCCLEFVLRQTPSFLLNAPYDEMRFGCVSTNESVPMLEKLTEEFGVAADESLQLHLNSTENYFQTLLNKDGELDSESLCNEYRKIYKKEGDLDELLFFSNDPHLLPPQANRVSSLSSGQPKLSPEQMTPVRVVVSTVQQLQENFAKLPEEPSEKLRTYFQKCIKDPSETIKNMIASLKDNFVLQYQTNSCATGQQKVAELRFTLGLKLYFKVLEAMMDMEGERLTQQVLNTLLNKENFHKSLLACAMEVVLTTYGQSWNHSLGEMSSELAAFSFPWILGVFSLQAFEFYKVVESFIRSEPKLPADVVKHLHNVEMQILDSLAWLETSTLFDLIGDCDLGTVTPPMPASPMKMAEGMNGSPLAFTGYSRCAVDLFSSPIRPSQIPVGSSVSPSHIPPSTPSSQARQQVSATDPSTSDARSCPPRSQSLSHFLKRVLSLGFSRLNKLCGYLGVSKDLQHKIWTCFEYCITRTPALLKNRHIDQIIMCCIYGICKVVDQEIRFKSIVSEYRNLPHAKQEVFKDVYITNNRHDSIINFYNHIFMQEIKSFLLQFSPSRGLRPQLSPMPKQNLASPSCYSVPGKKNFTVSPLRESPFKTPGFMTPRSKLLYNFGETSSEKLKEFNEAINPRVGLASAKKRLNMDMLPSAVSKVRKMTM